MIVVHAGNRLDSADRVTPRFPAANAENVRKALTAVLGELEPRVVVTAAAGGADLLILEAAEQLGISTIVVLPLPVDEFRQKSVDDLGADWADRYRAALAAAKSVVVVDLSDYDDWYLRGNEAIIDNAQDLGIDDEEVVAVVVSNLLNDGESATADFAATASDRGLRIVPIDPMLAN